MPFSIQNAKDELAGIIHGKTVNKVTNPDGAARRAAANILSQIDPDETRRYAQITLYDGVTDYDLPMTDLKEKRVFDVRPQTDRHRSDNLGSRMSKEFDLKKWDNWFTIEDDTGTKYIRVSKRLRPGAASIDDMDSATGWAGSGGASAPAVDTIYSYDGGSSLKFNLAAAGTPGYLTKSTILTRDMSDWGSSFALFLPVYLPNAATDVTAVKIRIGSSAGAYLEKTGVVHFGAQRQGWNLLRFDLSSAAVTGAPNYAALTYVRIELDYPAPGVTGVRVDRLFASLPRIWEIGYYSKFLFLNGTTWQDTVEDDDTSLNLDTTSFNIFMYEFALEALQQISGKDAAYDRVTCREKLFGDGQNLRGLYAEYRKNNPSQAQKVTQTTYTNLRFRRK